MHCTCSDSSNCHIYFVPSHQLCIIPQPASLQVGSYIEAASLLGPNGEN
jgi:hypothetical protein